MNIILNRKPPTSSGVFGSFSDEHGNTLCCTLERAYPDGITLSPKIPYGKSFTAIRRFSPHFKCELFMLTDVPGHEFIEIHPANLESQLDGCIATGDSEDGKELLKSRDAFERFMKLQEGVNSFTLIVSGLVAQG